MSTARNSQSEGRSAAAVIIFMACRATASEVLREMLVFGYRGILGRKIQLVLIGVILIITAAALHRLYDVAKDHLQAPHDIFFETYNLATIESIKAGAPIYSPSFYTDLPFIITIYNPLYHYLVAALPSNPSNPFFYGRLVSLVSIMLTSSLLFLPGQCRRNLVVPFLCIGWFFLIHAPVLNAAYLRCDTFGVLLSASAVICAEKAQRKHFRIVLAAFFAFLAFAAKQNLISATVACVIYLYWLNRRDGIVFAIASTVFYGCFLAYASLFWGTGYWFSVYLSVLKNPMYWSRMISNWSNMFAEPLFTALAVTTLIGTLYAFSKERSEVFKGSPYFIYVFSTLFILISSSGKFGSDTNHFLEFIEASLLWLVFFVRSSTSVFASHPFSRIIIVPFCALALVELHYAERQSYSYTDKNITAHYQAVFDLARKEISELKPPNNRFLAVNTWVNLYTLQTEGYLNDPINYWLMWSIPVLDIAPLLRAIDDEYFSLILIVTKENPYNVNALNYIPDSPSLRRLIERLDKHYVVRKEGVFRYFAPLHETR